MYKLEKIACFIVFIICNIILLIVLYIIFLFPFNNKYGGYGKAINNISKFYTYDNKSLILAEQKQIITFLLGNIDIFKTECIQWQKDFKTQISSDDIHKRAFGYIIIYGTYDNLDDLKEFLKMFNIEEEQVINKCFYLFDSQVDNIFINSNNSLCIYLATKLPYKYNINNIDSFTGYEKYFMKINESNRKIILKESYIAKFKCEFIYILFNICYIAISYKYFKIIKKFPE